jgi:chromatin assembly factor 1 subunit B
MVFAIATVNQVLIYSTDSLVPLAVIGNTHYAPINDMAWCTDGRLCACSSDGYVSIMKLTEEMLGERLSLELIPEDLKEFYEENAKVNLK